MDQIDSSASGYERRKRRKRSQIIAAATELFRNRGFAHVSVKQIADHANVSQVTIYNHFGDKHGLVAEVMKQLSAEKIEQYRQVLTSDAPWTQRLRAVIVDKKKAFREYRGEFIETLYREYPEVIRDIRERQVNARESITYPFLDEGRRLGYVPRDISNEAVSAYLQIVMKGLDESPEFLRRVTESPGLFDDVYDLMIFGLISGTDAKPGDPDPGGIST